MTRLVNVADLVEENGKTWRENRLAIQHEIPLGSLVEISHFDPEYPDDPPGDFDGVRLFVVQHQRDCDGSPLYGLSFNKELLDMDLAATDPITRAWCMQISGGHGPESLTVIKEPAPK